MRRDRDDKAKDDDGHFLKDEAGTFAPLEVGHIIPHSLMNVSLSANFFGWPQLFSGCVCKWAMRIARTCASAAGLQSRPHLRSGLPLEATSGRGCAPP
jgi:hypothetical protein